jgi:hypothetical protein
VAENGMHTSDCRRHSRRLAWQRSAEATAYAFPVEITRENVRFNHFKEMHSTISALEKRDLKANFLATVLFFACGKVAFLFILAPIRLVRRAYKENKDCV